MLLLENIISVKAITYDTEAVSVDTPKDINRIRQIMESRGMTYVDYTE